jgi:DNA-binding response OmpR family regulator
MSQKRILFIDNDVDVHDIITVILEEEGVELINAVDIAGVGAIVEIKPDLILLDEWLPDTKGSMLCSELKDKKETAHIPVVLISAVWGLEMIAKKCRADAFINKPFDIDQFKQVVKSCITAGRG